MNRRKRIGLWLLLSLITLSSGLFWLTYRNANQERLNDALFTAIGHEDLVAVNTLLAQGANPNAQHRVYQYPPGWQGFWYRLRYGDLDAKSGKFTPLLLAVNGAEIPKQIEINANGQTICHTHTRGLRIQPWLDTKEPTVVQMLVNKGAYLNTRGYMGRTALMWAVHDGCIQTAVILMENGADVNVRDDYGDTALHLAEEQPHLTALLKKAGAKD